MTSQHPLTDEICFDISEAALEEFYSEPFDMWDAPEEFFSEDVLMNMRAAADWQLEQVIEWLRDNLHLIDEDGSPRYLKNTSYYSCAAIDAWKLIDALKEAMRPRQQLEDN